MSLFKEIQKFALPLILNNFLQLAINQLILFLAVNQSLENLAGITTIQSLLYALAGILSVVALAFNIEGGQVLGRGEHSTFLELIKSSLIINSLVGLIFALVTVIFGRLFLMLTYGFQGQMLETATFYLLTQAPYIFLTLMMFLSSNLIKIENKTNFILYISLITTAVEILLNLAFVHFLKMGIVGAGLASTLSLVFMVFLQVIVVRKQIASALKEKARHIKKLLQKALPLGGQELLEGVIFTIVFEALIARLGVTTLAIYGLCAQALNIIKMPTYMYENAVTIFGARAYGEQKLAKIKKIMSLTLVSSTAFYLLFSLLIFINARAFANLFSPKMSTQFPSYLLIVLVSSVFFILYENFKGILQAMNLEKFVLHRTFIINLALFALMISTKILGLTSFTLLFSFYGASLMILSLLFFRKFHLEIREI